MELSTRTGSSDGKESACNVGNPGLNTGSGRSPGEKMATHSSTEGAWQATVHGVTKSQIRLND